MASTESTISDLHSNDEEIEVNSRARLPFVPLDDAISVHNIRNFLNYNGGKVKHSELMEFFKRPLTDPMLKARNRNEFKDILVKLASFGVENGERYITLKGACKQQKCTLPKQMDHHQQEKHYHTDNAGSTISSTFDSGINAYPKSIADSAAAKSSGIYKSTESLGDELMNDIFDNEADDQYDGSSIELNPDEKTWTMLSSLCDCQKLAVLMDQNPNLPGKRDFATTALHWGAKLGRRDLVRLIADTGIDVNYRTGQTALHLAAKQGHDDVIKMLLNDYNADVHARDYAGKKPKDIVKDTVSPELQRKLGRSLILDPNIHLISGVTRNAKDDHFARVENEDYIDASITPETRRRLRTMSFLKKKKKWPPEKYDSDDENERQKRTVRPKSSIVLLTPDLEAKYRQQSTSLTSFEI